MASMKGAYLEKIRYDLTTPYRIEKYLERENWSNHEWKSWFLLQAAIRVVQAGGWSDRDAGAAKSHW